MGENKRPEVDKIRVFVGCLVGSARLPSNLGLQRVRIFCLKGFIGEPRAPKKGRRALLGTLVWGGLGSGSK